MRRIPLCRAWRCVLVVVFEEINSNLCKSENKRNQRQEERKEEEDV